MSFFFSRPFHENFKFLKNCPYDFHKILHSLSTLKGAPVYSKASKSYDWSLRNIAKTSPKWPKIAQIQPFFDFFHCFKNCPYDSNEILCSHSTTFFSIFSKTVHTALCILVRSLVYFHTLCLI